jgi:hypothetical protein
MISYFKPSTVNIRLRTLRCYLKWLYSEGMTKEDISTKTMKYLKILITIANSQGWNGHLYFCLFFKQRIFSERNWKVFVEKYLVINHWEVMTL